MVMRVKELREMRGLTQQQLADDVGVIRNAVSNWERELSLPRTRQLPILANALSCSIDALFVREPPPSMSREAAS